MVLLEILMFKVLRTSGLSKKIGTCKHLKIKWLDEGLGTLTSATPIYPNRIANIVTCFFALLQSNYT